MAFRFEYEPGTIRYGAGCVSTLDSELAAVGVDRPLVVTGRTVGSTAAVMDPVREGLGDRHAGTFAETTPEKTLSTAIEGVAAFEARDADGIVAVGGGSSLDVAKVIAAAVPSDRSGEELLDAFEATGTIPMPEGELPPVAAVPTTLAGADLSVVAGITSRRDGLVRGGVSDRRLMPAVLCYDTELFRTTPDGVLCASAMNGFDKAIETLYAEAATPITDGTAVRALEQLRSGLPALGAGRRDEQTLREAVVGTILAQYGSSRPDATTLSIIHAFGHGIARGYDVQQGGAHGIIAPHALEALFESVDGRRALLASGLGVGADDPEAAAAGIVEAVADVRDALGLPSRLREIDDMAESDLPEVAASVHGDGFMDNCPPGFDPSVEELEATLRRAW